MRTHINEKFQSIPARACLLSGGELELGTNGEKAKTAPVRLKARSGEAIEHWYFGRVVHDLAGMRMHKARLPIDYAHNESEVLGYLNHFDAASGDLMASGALTPFQDGDRASEVIFKMAQGVPYEASIFFGGDGIKLQEIAEGEVTQVNGREFAGPGVVIREWPLRGVAICPYGADANTESAAMSSTTKQAFSASAWTPEEGIPMADEAIPAAVEAPESVPVEVTEQTEQTEQAVEAVQAEEVVEAAPEGEAVEAAPVEAAPAEALTEEPVPEPQPDPRDEFKRMVTDFGAELAAEVFADGGTYADAKEKHFARLAEENKRLKHQVATLASAGGDPAAFAPTGEKIAHGGVHPVFEKGTRRQ